MVADSVFEISNENNNLFSEQSHEVQVKPFSRFHFKFDLNFQKQSLADEEKAQSVSHCTDEAVCIEPEAVARLVDSVRKSNPAVHIALNTILNESLISKTSMKATTESILEQALVERKTATESNENLSNEVHVLKRKVAEDETQKQLKEIQVQRLKASISTLSRSLATALEAQQKVR